MTVTTQAADVPAPTEFELSISAQADRVLSEGKTGYNWTAVDELLSAELNSEPDRALTTRCKHASNSGRAANVLTESMDKDFDLYLVFISRPYSVAQFVRVVEKRIPRFPKVRTVAIAERVNDVWRVTTIVHRSDDRLVDRISGHFPCVAASSTHSVAGAPLGSAGGVAPPSGHTDVEEILAAALRARTSLVGLEDLPRQLVDFALAKDVSLDLPTAADALACALGSQFVLFAGPSGTGKSTLARLLAQFLSSEESSGVVEARSGWSGPEDLVGYFSNLTNKFAQTPETSGLLALHESSVSFLSTESAEPIQAPSPVLLVEEANLSAIESYLAPLIHGLSAPSSPLVSWNVHAQREGANDSDELLEVPPTILLAPWPRVFATINVDANSAAPARKVTARAAVLVLEPEESLDPASHARRLVGTPPAVHTGEPADVSHLGDPAAARRALPPAELTTLLNRYRDLLVLAAGSDPALVPSRRDIERAANLMAYFVRLTGWDGSDDALPQIAAEHALMHTMLTQLPSHRFAQSIDHLKQSGTLTTAAVPFGGGLRSRIDRLAEVTAGSMFRDTVDFWAALS